MISPPKANDRTNSGNLDWASLSSTVCTLQSWHIPQLLIKADCFFAGEPLPAVGVQEIEPSRETLGFLIMVGLSDIVSLLALQCPVMHLLIQKTTNVFNMFVATTRNIEKEKPCQMCVSGTPVSKVCQ